MLVLVSQLAIKHKAETLVLPILRPAVEMTAIVSILRTEIETVSVGQIMAEIIYKDVGHVYVYGVTGSGDYGLTRKSKSKD